MGFKPLPCLCAPCDPRVKKIRYLYGRPFAMSPRRFVGFVTKTLTRYLCPYALCPISLPMVPNQYFAPKSCR
jgi:hypothetical protein